MIYHTGINTNRKTIFYSLLSCELFFARTYNLLAVQYCTVKLYY